MHLRGVAERQDHPPNLLHRGSIDDHQLGAHLAGIVGGADQPAISLLGGAGARDEARLLQHVGLAAEARLDLAGPDIEAAEAVGGIPQLGVRARAGRPVRVEVLNIDIAVGQTDVAVVDAGEAGHRQVEQGLLGAPVVLGIEVESDAADGVPGGGELAARQVFEPRPGVPVGNGRFQDHLGALGAGVGGVDDRTLGPEEPADVLGVPVTRDDPVVGRLGGIPGPVDLALVQPLRTGHAAAAGDDHVLPRQGHVVQHAGVRNLEAPLAGDASRPVEDRQKHIPGAQA